jgi:signal transduction histidine kinase/ligand-binding sensor domain-containing protein
MSCEKINKNALHYFLLLMLQFICAFSFGQRQPLRFEHIGTSSGLSQSNVICIFQDSRGFMWFGTRDGLNRYDGYKFTVYKFEADNPQSISHNTVQDIAEDNEGNLWIATWGGGLNKFEWQKERFTRFSTHKSDPFSVSNEYINKLLFDSEGNLWIGTEGGGLNLYDKKTNRFIKYFHNDTNPASLSNNWVKDIVEDRQHNLWISTHNGGVNLFDRKRKTFRHFRHDNNNPHLLASDNNWELFVDSRDRLWVGTRGQGLDLFDRQKEEFIHFRNIPGNNNSLQSNVIKAIGEDDKGNLWVGTENGGLAIMSLDANGVFENYLQDDADKAGINNNSIWSIFRDAKGNMWIGTSNAGIDFVNRDAANFTHYRHTSSPLSLSNNSVLSIVEDSDGDIWLGTDGGGMNLFDPVHGTFKHYKNDPANTNSISGNYVLDLYEDSEKNLWVGTWGSGVTVFNKRTNKYRHFVYNPSGSKGLSSPNVWTICEDADKNVWLGTYNEGINVYDRKNDSFIYYRNDPSNPASLSNNTINIIFQDSDKNIWIGTNGSGLDLFDKKTKTFIHFSHSDVVGSISNDDVYCIREDRSGNLWIGTNLGLNKFDKKTRKFTAYYTRNGLPSNTIPALLIDKKGNLWAGTFNGMSRFNPATLNFKNFGISDGLQSDEFKMNSCFRASNGKMYFGGINGFNEFFPDSIREKRYMPPLVFTDFQIFNKHVPIADSSNKELFLDKTITDTKEITVPYDQSVISFEFASLNYAVQDKKQYSYMLEGFDRDWNYVGTRHTATYTNLNPGDYVFKVRGLDNEGKWSARAAIIHLTVTPPYWMTWWFRLVVVVAIICGIIGFYRYRVSAIRKQKLRLQRLVRQQTLRLRQSAEEEFRARQEAELAKLEVEEANVKLARKNKELEQFAYVASHDMQEPLRTTSSFVSLLQKQYTGRLDEKADKYLSYIAGSSDRMKVLIKDLLDFSRIGTKGGLEKVDSRQVVNTVLADLTFAIDESKASVVVHDLPVIDAYPTELKQLFQNLVYNAIKFRKKNVAPHIRINAQHNNDDEWLFSIQDNGIGIEQKHSERIFVIFQRLHSRSEYEGSGIGLAHCKKITELHGGRIWLESEPGTGTTFYFTIPDK